jgi:hypothetical protein
MALDLGEVLTRAWKITWENKIFWVFAIFSIVVSYLFLPLGLAPSAGIFLSEGNPSWLNKPSFWIGYLAAFLLIMVITFFVGALAQAAISVGVFRSEQGAKKFSFGELFKASQPFFWRFLGVMGLYTGGLLLFMAVVWGLQMLVSIFTLGLGTICLTPLSILIYPLTAGVYGWMEQALASIVVDNLGVFAAVRRGWRVFRANLLPVILVTLILYIGTGLVSGLVSIPLMVPFFAFLFSFLETAETSRTILIVSLLCAMIYLPFLAVFQSVALTYVKSGWLLTYLRLTRNAETDVVVSDVA